MSIEQKLEMFARAAEGEAQKQREDMQELMDRRIKDALEAAKQDALVRAEKKLELEVYRIKLAQKRELVGCRNIVRKKAILRRAELTRQLENMVREALAEYVRCDEYREWLGESIRRALREWPDATVVLRPADYECLELMGTTASNKVQIGGYRLACSGFVVDCTFETRLDELIEGFCGFE